MDSNFNSNFTDIPIVDVIVYNSSGTGHKGYTTSAISNITTGSFNFSYTGNVTKIYYSAIGK